MKLDWSHTVLNIKDKDKILDFYTKALGFKVSDSGPIYKDGPEIIFVSWNPDEHHQPVSYTHLTLPTTPYV